MGEKIESDVKGYFIHLLIIRANWQWMKVVYITYSSVEFPENSFVTAHILHCDSCSMYQCLENSCVIVCSSAKRKEAKKEKETEWELEASGKGLIKIYRDYTGQIWRAHIERDASRVKQMDRSKNHGEKWRIELQHIFHSVFPAMPGPDMRIHIRLQLPSLSISPTLFSLPILCYYSLRLYVTHPLTLELKCSPPPALLICSLHYSFITHLCSLCSSSVSLFLFIP